MRRRNTSGRRSRPWRAIVVAALVLTAVSVASGWWLSTGPMAGSGTPRLIVDRESVDLGSLAFATPAHVAFTLTNAGDGTLRLTDTPRVKAVQGC